MSAIKTIAVFFSIMLLFSSCDKKEFNAYVGSYQGNEGNKSWNGIDPTLIQIDPGKSLDVLKDGKFVNVNSEKIHIDDLEPGEAYFEGDTYNYFKLRFSNDSVYFERSSGNEMEGSSYSFRGAKVN